MGLVLVMVLPLFMDLKVEAEEYTWTAQTATWRVPYSGWYEFEVAGGQGGLCYSSCQGSSCTGDGGFGAIVSGEVYLTGGTTLTINAATQASNNTCPTSHNASSYTYRGDKGGTSSIYLGGTPIIWAEGGMGGSVHCNNEIEREDGTTKGRNDDNYYHGEHADEGYVNPSYRSRNVTYDYALYWWNGQSDKHCTKVGDKAFGIKAAYGTKPHDIITGGNGTVNVTHNGVYIARENYRYPNWHTFGHWDSHWSHNGFYSQIIRHNAKTGYVRIKSLLFDIDCDMQSGTGGTDRFYNSPNLGFLIDPEGAFVDKIVVPTRVGYIFHGYFTGKKGTGDKIIDVKGNILVGNNYFKDDAIIYAYWIPIEYNVNIYNNKPDEATSDVVNIK